MFFKNTINLKTGVFLTLSTLSTAPLASNFEAPSSCAYGRHQGDVPVYQLEGAIEAGYDYYNDPNSETTANLWQEIVVLIQGVFEDYDYLRVEVPKYVLQGEYFRAKGNLFDTFAYVRFHNSELGYIGKDKSSIEANSYYHMKFPSTHGIGAIWITRGDNSQCSMETVYVQKRPKILNSTHADTSRGGIDVDFSFEVDSYSKAAQDSDTDVEITVIATSDSYGTSDVKTKMVSANETQEGFKIYPSAGGGVYHVDVRVDDGTYSVTKELGMVHVQGQEIPPCERCDKH